MRAAGGRRYPPLGRWVSQVVAGDEVAVTAANPVAKLCTPGRGSPARWAFLRDGNELALDNSAIDQRDSPRGPRHYGFFERA